MIICYGCDGKKLVNYVKLRPNQIFTDNIPTEIRKCLICKGKGEITYGKNQQ